MRRRCAAPAAFLVTAGVALATLGAPGAGAGVLGPAVPAPRPVPDVRWSRAREPAPGPASAIGGYANGCLRGGVALAGEGPHWVVMRASRRRYFGHPDLVAFVARLAAAARARKLPPLFVGDLAQARGGPTLTGHASHQTGLDADVEFVPPRDPAAGPLSPREREDLPALAVVDLTSGKPTAAFAPSALALLELAASDPSVARIFVNPWLKKRLCDASDPKARPAWHGRVRPWWGHHDHFHVRLKCPAGDAACTPQPALQGDGCDASLAFWFSPAAKTAPAKEPPPPLPAACDAIAP